MKNIQVIQKYGVNYDERLYIQRIEPECQLSYSHEWKFVVTIEDLSVWIGSN
ncbi:MAG: hypothetical protein OXI43_05665 [Candidatus Poribacteria bacterium]|nr:hypothetical protein [Candidatus Poribacteria bacterium]